MLNMAYGELDSLASNSSMVILNWSNLFLRSPMFVMAKKLWIL